MASEKVRKPRPFTRNKQIVARIVAPDYDGQCYMIEYNGWWSMLYADDAAAFGAWLTQAAAWIEQQEKSDND